MNVTQQGKLSTDDAERLLTETSELEYQREHYKALVLQMVEKSSYREVARITRLSTATLQRWKREAGK